ncbi:alpha/beta fold hydrolase [Reyranella sp.]|uniref:alpha/beta fold hydrolase n=1 Tax=Reyranella sp. TaxID=1929291 RepID=UPI003BADB7C1
MKIPSQTKPVIWGAVGGAILCAVVGFSWGGWVTGATARKEAAVAATDSRVAALAPICAQRFRAQDDASAKIAALAKADWWDRSKAVEKSGFAVMPGSKEADSDVARACAEILAKSAPGKS